MSIHITVVGHILTLLGAIIGILGNTSNPAQMGFKRLTRLGWCAAIVASLGISLTIFKSIDDYITSTVYTQIALKDIRGGWRQVATPFFLLEWEVNGEAGDISVAAIKNIRDSGILTKFDRVDFTRKTQIKEYAEWDLGRLACRTTSQGMKIMESSVKANADRISRDIAKKVQELRQSSNFAKFLAAGCGNTLERKPNYALFKDAFDTEEMKAYLSLLIDLGNELGDPGRKR